MTSKILPVLFTLVLMAPFGFVQAQDINLTNYTLTFDDEFNSLSISTSNPKGSANWFAGPANGSTGDFSDSTWTSNAFSVSSGILTDEAFYSGGKWYSGMLSSVDPSITGFTQQYGYFEIRCQMPNAGEGAWPAFWLDTTAGIPGGPGGVNEEVDIFEWYGVENTPGSEGVAVQQASHNWNTNGTQNNSVPYLYSPSTSMPDGQYPWQGYHIFGCQIDPLHITWYIDGVQTNQIATPTSYINSPFYLILDYALGGGWSLSGTPFTTDGSSSLSVDWVRVYQLPTYPVVVGPTTANGTVGTPFSYQITAYNTTTAYSASGLPPGLTLNTSTGVISGTPTATGTSTVLLGATNANGTGAATLTLTVSGINIGLDFSGSGSTPIPATTPAGFLPETNWNNLTTAAPGSLSTVTDATGAVISGLSASWSSHSSGSNSLSGYGGSKFPSTGDVDLFSKAWTIVAATPGAATPWGGTFTVTGIPYSKYDVYVYAEGDAGKAGLVNLNGTFPTDGDPTGGTTSTFTLLGDTMNSYVQATSAGGGANYAVFPGITGSSLVINGRIGGADGGLVGIQIVNTSAPVITSASSASGQANSSFNYQITATNTPTSYGATGLPSGLTLNATTGTITGTPSPGAVGTSIVVLTATNAYGTGSANLSLTIAAASAQPIGLDFSGAGTTPIPSGTSAGAVPQSNWNNLSVDAPSSLSTIVDGSGTTISGLSASWSSHTNGSNTLSGFGSSFTSTGDKDLFSKSWIVFGATPGAGTPWGGTFTVSGIPFSTYDVYVYTEGNADQSALVNLNGTFPKDGDPVGGTTFDLTQLGKTMNSYVEATGAGGGANYVLFTNVTGATATINARAGAGNGGVVGIQIVPVSP